MGSGSPIVTVALVDVRGSNSGAAFLAVFALDLSATRPDLILQSCRSQMSLKANTGTSGGSATVTNQHLHQIDSPAIYQPCEVQHEDIIELASKHASLNICRCADAIRQHLQRCELSSVCHKR
jgi:hypothetical protein